jgi:hypothetical protein
MSRMRVLFAVGMASIALAATEARTSGSYSNSFLSASFKYSYQQNVRKIFADAESSSSYFEEHDRETKARFVDMQPKLEKAIKAAKIGAYDPFLPAVSATDVAKLKVFPVNVSLRISSGMAAEEHVEVTLTQAMNLSSLAATLKGIAKKARADVDVPAAMFDKPPLAATHIDDLFGLYVGTTAEVMAQDRAKLLENFQARIDRMLPALKKRFATPGNLMLEKPLMTLKPVVDKHPQGLPRAFHPWGPLVSGELIRMTVEMGSSVDAILMIAPEKYDWAKVHPVMREWLVEAIGDPHLAKVTAEIERLSNEEQ